MNESKLPEALATMTAAWVFNGVGWLFDHYSAIGITCAIAASIWSIQASRETIKTREG